MDLFEEWLSKKKSKWGEIALRDSSYKAQLTKGIKKTDPNFVSIDGMETNADLALLGDAVIKLIYADYFYGKTDRITEKKAEDESDKTFVEKVAKHYDLIRYIKRDESNADLPVDYCYDKKPGEKKNSHKYIATCVEAIIGAMYKERMAFSKIKALVISWISF